MPTQKYISFGNLTSKTRNINTETKELDYLFANMTKKLENFKIINAERERAMSNLRALTAQLQTKRLRKKLKDKYELFQL